MNINEFSVRPLRESDLNGWFRLRRTLWDATGDDDHRYEMLDIIDHVDTQFVLVACDLQSNVVGFLEVSIRPFVEDCHTENVGYLEGWFVEEHFRRKGIGRELVKQAENWARQKGCTEMASDTEVGNSQCVASHSSLGYVETSRLVHLRKDLN